MAMTDDFDADCDPPRLATGRWRRRERYRRATNNGTRFPASEPLRKLRHAGGFSNTVHTHHEHDKGFGPFSKQGFERGPGGRTENIQQSVCRKVLYGHDAACEASVPFKLLL